MVLEESICVQFGFFQAALRVSALNRIDSAAIMREIQFTDTQRLFCQSAAGLRVRKSFYRLEQFPFIFSLDDFVLPQDSSEPIGRQSNTRDRGSAGEAPFQCSQQAYSES